MLLSYCSKNSAAFSGITKSERERARITPLEGIYTILTLLGDKDRLQNFASTSLLVSFSV